MEIGKNRLNEDFIKKIIENSIYKGYTCLGGEEFKGEHRAIVSKDAWEKANEKIKPKNAKKTEYAKDSHIHLLKGFTKCGECDALLTPYPAGKKDRHGVPYLYYACGRVVDDGKNSTCKVRMIPAREFENVIKKCLSDLGRNKALIESAIKGNHNYNAKKIKPLQGELNKTDLQLRDMTVQINRLVSIMKSKDMVGKEIAEEYKKLLKEKGLVEIQREKLLLDIERCKQDIIDAETVKKTLLAFDKIINSLPMEDQKELFQLLIKEIIVWSFDPAKEKAPKELGAFVTKIRTKWFKIKLSLYQFPEIEAYYKSLSQKKASSDFQPNWLPR